MRRYWWTVWIKVAVLAIVLLVAYNFASDKIEEMFSPYLIEETEATDDIALEEATGEDENILTGILSKIESTFDVKIDYENMIFDYANEYAQTIKEEAREERNTISEPLS